MNDCFKIFVFAFIIVCHSCKPKEIIVNQEYKKQITPDEIEKKIFNKNNDIKTLKLSNINLTVNVNDNNYNLNGTVGIIKDSIMVISIIPVMGFELARIYCTKDSILVIDRKNKLYYKSSYIKKLREYNFQGDYDFIQASIMNQPFIYGKNSEEKAQKKEITNKMGYYYYTVQTTIGENVTIQQRIKINANLWQVENNEIVDYQNKIKLNINYGDFKKQNKYKLPKTLEVKIGDEKQLLYVRMDIGDININEKINADINIPMRYKKVLI